LAPVVVCDWSAAIALARCGGASAAPMRQPVIAYALLAPAMITVRSSSSSGRSSSDGAGPLP
jgi:hypothetical protein